MENDRTYYMRRAAQERSAASNAVDGKAREAHLAMALRYQQLTEMADVAERRSATAETASAAGSAY